MGHLGTLLYTDDPKTAADLNAKEDQLRKNSNLHNDLLNSYRTVGEAVKSLDA